MFNLFKKTTTDLVKKWNTVYTKEVINNPSLPRVESFHFGLD